MTPVMTCVWRKAFRDLRYESTRTSLVVLAIAVGVAGFAAVLASYAILTRELNRGYLATNPASATLRTDAVDDALLAAVASTRGVAQVEARRTLSGRIRGGTKGWRNLVLFVVSDFAKIRVSKLNPERGAWPPGPGEMLIERDAFQVARVRIGDDVVVRTVNGPERKLRVAGSVHDVGQAQARMENAVYGYITAATLAELGEEPLLNQLKIVVDGDTRDERHIRAVVEDVKSVAAQHGHSITRIDIPTPGKHPHADIMGLLMLSLASFGLFVLLLSGVIVVNLLTALMAAQVRQIGVMKAVGGTRWQIARIYFVQALLLGAAATAIALPLGVWGSRVLCRAQAVFLNFDITSFAIPLWVYLLVVLMGMIVPLIAAAVPVWRGSAISVRRAFADFGVAPTTFGASTFDRAVAGIGGITRPLLLAIRNNFRRRTRVALTVLTLAAGGLFFMTALNLRASMIRTLDRLFDARKSDISVSISGMAQTEEVERALICHPERQRGTWVGGAGDGIVPPAAQVPRYARDDDACGTPGMRSVEMWMAMEASTSGDRFTILALPPRTTMFTPTISAGRWLAPNESDAMVINSALAAKSAEMRVGNRVTFPMGPGSVTMRIAGVSRETFSPPTAYISRAFFDERAGHSGMTNSLRIVLDRHDAASVDRAKAAIEERLERAGIKTVSVSSKGDSRFGFDQHMLMIYVALIVMSAMIGGVGGLGLMTTMSENVLERRREMGVLRAVGAAPRTVWLMLAAEACAAAVMSWALAGLAAWPLSKGLGNFLVRALFKSGLEFTFELRGLFLWLAFSLVLGAIASFIPAWHATTRPVREALGYE